MKQKPLIKIVGFCKILIFVNIFLLNLLTKFLEKLNLDIEKLVVIQTRNTIKTSVFSFELVGTRNFRHSNNQLPPACPPAKMRGAAVSILPSVDTLASTSWQFIL